MNWVGYGKLRFHERCVLLLAVYCWVCSCCVAACGILLGVFFLLSSANCIIGLIIIIVIIIADKLGWIKQHNDDLKELHIPSSIQFIKQGRKIGRKCSTNRGDGKYIQGFRWEET